MRGRVVKKISPMNVKKKKLIFVGEASDYVDIRGIMGHVSPSEELMALMEGTESIKKELRLAAVNAGAEYIVFETRGEGISAKFYKK